MFLLQFRDGLFIMSSLFYADRDECISAPCLNGGTCKDGQNRFDCTCKLGWKGTTCGDIGKNNIFKDYATNAYV